MKAVHMPSDAPPTLADLHGDVTHNLIVQSALDVLEAKGVPELTFRNVAARANVSERTVFRYFPTRDNLLDAVALGMRSRLPVPESPTSVEELLQTPAALFRGLETNAALAKAGMHPELFDRIRVGWAHERWTSIRKILDHHAPHAPAHARKLVSATLRYLLSASSWKYYRFVLDLSADETIEAVTIAIRQALDDLARDEPRRRR